MAADSKITGKRIASLFLAAFITMFLFLFVPAWTLDYWQAWAYIGVIFVPAIFILAYFLKKDPEFLERRMRFQEKEKAQKRIINYSLIVFVIGFLLPGLDRHFGWSSIPKEAVIAADIIVFLSYILIFLAFRENRFAARTIGVDKGQTVISSGPYAIVRHPMYVGSILLYTFTPIALGSLYALPIFLLMPLFLVYRILNEEEVLKRELPGYEEYCHKTKYRLIPFVW